MWGLLLTALHWNRLWTVSYTSACPHPHAWWLACSPVPIYCSRHFIHAKGLETSQHIGDWIQYPPPRASTPAEPYGPNTASYTCKKALLYEESKAPPGSLLTAVICTIVFSKNTMFCVLCGSQSGTALQPTAVQLRKWASASAIVGPMGLPLLPPLFGFGFSTSMKGRVSER